MVALIACAVSGAGIVPWVRAHWIAASKTAVWLYA
jgi:hypothetical protein